MSLSLERLQAEFAAALLDPARAGAIATQVTTFDANVLDRLALYRANVDSVSAKALANAYPVVKALVGADFFAFMARAYSLAHPSDSGDLNRYGARLAHFVATFEPARSLPYLADVATLEWLVCRAHHAADGEGVPRERITALPATQLLGARVRLHPAVGWIESAFPVAGIWLAHQADSAVALPNIVGNRECALIVRPRWRVEVVRSSPGEIAALKQLHGRADIECAIGAALAVEAQFNFARALVRWLDCGLLVDLHPLAPGATCGS